MANCETCGRALLPHEHFRKDGRSHGWYTSKRFCSWKCSGEFANKLAREAAALRARGRFIDKHGYVILSSRAGEGGYQQPEHRAAMEKMLGRKLEKYETVHHKNGIRHDNRPENLELWTARHGRGQRVTDLEPDIWSGMIPHYQFDAHV